MFVAIILPYICNKNYHNMSKVTMKPEISSSLQQVVIEKTPTQGNIDSDEIAIGTICKNGGCGITFEGSETNETTCTYHPGIPIFHEGLKYWSCCQKKTTDFDTFLSQVGCERGNHVWKKEVSLIFELF